MTDPTPPRTQGPPPRRQIAHEEVARLARQLWERYGQPSGRDEQIWLEAERQLRGLDLTKGAAAARVAAEAAAAPMTRAPSAQPAPSPGFASNGRAPPAVERARAPVPQESYAWR